jgi:hypothetical protein
VACRTLPCWVRLEHIVQHRCLQTVILNERRQPPSQQPRDDTSATLSQATASVGRQGREGNARLWHTGRTHSGADHQVCTCAHACSAPSAPMLCGVNLQLLYMYTIGAVNHMHSPLDCRLEETETLLAAQRDVNRGLDRDVHTLMAQLEDLNRRYAALGRRTAGLQVPDFQRPFAQSVSMASLLAKR